MKKWLNNWVDSRLRERDRSFFEAQIRRAAKDALHYYTCVRTIDQWRTILNEAEKNGDKYVSMAELIVASGFDKREQG